MSETSVRIFLSSPSDVAAERAAVERVAARLNGRFAPLKLEVYRYEADTYFSAHTGFQEQIPDVTDLDIVVGILWSRIGSALPPDFPRRIDPTTPYPSGTAFELLTAIDHRRSEGSENPDIFVYRKLAGPPAVAPDQIDAYEKRLSQLRVLNDFISRWFVNETDGFSAAFTSFETTSEFEERIEQHLRKWITDHRVSDNPVSWRVEDRGSPYRGLKAFDVSHRDVFFGRGTDIERARERLADTSEQGNRFLLIEGASGSGKSSLARAGLMPRLSDLNPDRIAIALQAGNGDAGPVMALATALFDSDLAAELASGDFTTADALASHLLRTGNPAPIVRACDRRAAHLADIRGLDQRPGVEVVLLIDQLEELFASQIATDERDSFAEVLSGLAESPQALIVATLRADQLAKALEHDTLLRLIDSGARLSLASPGAEALAEIVRAPARAAGLAFEIGPDGVPLDDRLLRETEGAAALPLLQFTLEQLFIMAQSRAEKTGGGDLTLSVEDYDALGGIGGAIGQQAEAAFAQVDESARKALPRLIRALTDFGGVANPVLRSVPLGIVAQDPATQRLAARLTSARILVQDAQSVRLSHERVLTSWPRARTVVDAAERFLRVRAALEQAEADWRTAGQRRDLLLPAGLRLAEAEDLVATYSEEIPAKTIAYVEASGLRARRTQRLTRAAALIFAVVSVFALWSFNDALKKGNLARDAAALAEAESERTARALSSAETHLRALQQSKSQQLASEAFDALDARAYDRALTLAVASAGPAGDDWPDVPLSSAALAAANLSASFGYAVPLATLRGHEGTVQGGLVTTDGARALTWSLDGTARIWDTATASQRHVLSHEGPVLGGRLLDDDTRFATFGLSPDVTLWNVETGDRIADVSHAAVALGVVAFDEGRSMVSFGVGGDVIATSAADGRSLGNFESSAPVRAVVLSQNQDRALVLTGGVTLLDLPNLDAVATEVDDTSSRFDAGRFIGDDGDWAAWSGSGRGVIGRSDGTLRADVAMEEAILGMVYLEESEAVFFWTAEEIRRVDIRTGQETPLITNQENLSFVDRVPGRAWLAWATSTNRVHAISEDGVRQGVITLDGVVETLTPADTDGQLLAASSSGRVVGLSVAERSVSRGGDPERPEFVIDTTGQTLHDSPARLLNTYGNIAISGGKDGTLRFWVMRTGHEIGRITHAGSVRGLATGGSTVLSWADEPAAKLWRWTPDPVLTERTTMTGTIKEVIVGPVQDRVALLNGTDTLQLIRLSEGMRRTELTLELIPRSAAFSPDESRLVLWSVNRVQLCDTSSGICDAPWALGSAIVHIQWQIDRLLIATEDGKVQSMWPDGTDARPIADLAAPISVEVFAEDTGSFVHGADSGVLMSDTLKGEPIVIPLTDLRPQNSNIGTAVLSHDGQSLFLSVSGDGGRHVDLQTGQVREFPELSKQNIQAQMLDETRFVVGSVSGGVWTIDTRTAEIKEIYNVGGRVQSIAALGGSGEFAVVAGAQDAETGIIISADGTPRAFFDVSGGHTRLRASAKTIIARNTGDQTFVLVDAATGATVLKSVYATDEPRLLSGDRLLLSTLGGVLNLTDLNPGRAILLAQARESAALLAPLDAIEACEVDAFSVVDCSSVVSDTALAQRVDERVTSSGTGFGNVLDMVLREEDDPIFTLELSVMRDGKLALFHTQSFREDLAFYLYSESRRSMSFVTEQGEVRSFGFSMKESLMKSARNRREVLAIKLDPVTGKAIEGFYIPLVRMR